MARPNVTIKVIDESLVAPIGETTSPGIGAMVSRKAMVSDLGNTGEKQSGLMTVEGITDLFGKLRNYAEKTLISEGVTGATLQGLIGVTAAGFINVGAAEGQGVTKAWMKEWWALHNFLQYGSSCLVGQTGTVSNTISNTSSLSDPTIGFDVIFMGDTGDADLTNLTSVVDSKAASDVPVLGVVARSVTDTQKATGANTEFYVNVAGSKYHLNGVGQGNLDASNLILTNLTPDVAGCITRCDRDSYPWFSPAGRVRGRILNVVRLLDNPTISQQDILFDAGINPVVTFPGEGTLLFGDKTGASDTSTLSRINVSRLFIYLRKVINPIARSILFEINDATTRARFALAATTVLEQVRGQRGITDYRIICDETNNPPELVQARVFVADILVKPTIAINYVRITFTNKNLNDNLSASL
ncbi:MAG: hypothetical protein FJ356_05350 [Thaumarchaeota archaeon]|nr:hypothetical protein [Nitrososphaerota archaeon]